MARLKDMPESLRKPIESLDCPIFENPSFARDVKLTDARVSIVSTAALTTRKDKTFSIGESDYRVIPGNVRAGDLIMSHISPNYDRTGFQQDLNVVFPIDRLNEMADEGQISSVGDYHYSLMGSSDPIMMESSADEISALLNRDGVNTLLLVPV